MPFSLGANAIIKDGSCKACAAETGKIEGSVGRGSLWDFRTHIKEQTRRPKERPKTIPFTVKINGEVKVIEDIAAEDAPFFTPYPVWGLPGILTGAAPTAEFAHQLVHVFYWIPPNIRETLGVSEGVDLEFPFPDFKPSFEKFGRAIMKMGYCHAVLKYGLHGFDRLATPAVILGQDLNVPYYVGTPLDDPPPVSSADVKHITNLAEVDTGSRKYIVASIRLYSNSGTSENGSPVYQAVIGAL